MNRNMRFLVIVVILLGLKAVHGASVPRICSYYEPSITIPDYIRQAELEREEDGYDYEEPILLNVNKSRTIEEETVVCERTEDYCYALWSLDDSQNVTLKKQGCWSVSDSKSVCDNKECVTEYDEETNKKYLFCCCNANMCNSRVTWKVVPTQTPTEQIPGADTDGYPHFHLLLDPIVWLALAFAFLLLVCLIFIVVLRRSEEFDSKEDPPPQMPSGPGYSANLQNVDNLKLVSLLGQGKYGTVWKGILNERSVAVKIFASHHKQYYLNEKEIYNTPLFPHKSLLGYFGCDERRTLDDRIEYMLVLSLAELGCLQDWLAENTTSFRQFCRMATTIAQGLSHLHTVVRKGEYVKPCICHRDLNSRNILVRQDLSCCLADFGFALKTHGPRYEYRGEMTLAETKSIMEVGTLRYMAPEILEGAVNLKDCESALQTIDVYSLGLVIWELATRCHDFYFNGLENVPAYLLPYEAEVGKHPSYEQMQILVSRQKVRPTFPSNWGCGNATRVIRETCEDCWDPDSEARLTSLCVEERLKGLCGPDTSTITIEEIIERVSNLSPSTIKPPVEQMKSDLSGPMHKSKNYLKYLIKSKGHLPKKRDSLKIGGKKVKRNKIEKTLSGWPRVRSLIQKRVFKRIKLDNDQSTPSHCPSVSSTPRSTAVRPTNLDIIPQLYRPPRKATVDSSDRVRLRNETKESAKLDKKNVVPARLSIHPIPDVTLCNPPVVLRPRLVVSKSANAMRPLGDEGNLKRQRSLEVFREVFGSQKSTEMLRDPSQRVKTPGDLPPSVRKSRASKTLSLYDDRMMVGWELGNTI